MQPLLQVVRLSKSFGTLPVIRQVSFEIHAGEVVGLTGSIGSGKSVLVMLLSGLYEPDEGEIYFAGKRLSWPFSANALGIGVIHQRPTLAEHLDVVSNIYLGNEIGWPRGLGPLRMLDYSKMTREAWSILNHLGVEINSLEEKVSNLSAEQRQMIAIARVFTYPNRLIVIDEPTVALSYPYQERLRRQIETWRDEGRAVLFSSNNLEHIFAVTDRIIVLHQGTEVATLRTDETTRETVVSLLVGTADVNGSTPAMWDFDSYDRIRENAEKLRFHQMLLEKDLASEDMLNRQLTVRFIEQVQTLDRVNLTLQEAQRRLLSEREEERKLLARELHDQIIQDLLSFNYDLEEVETELPQTLVERLIQVRLGIRNLVDDLRRICGSLRPPTIDSLGVGAAIQSYSRDWSSRTGIPVSLSLDLAPGRLPEAIELSIFRIVQEGLSNVWRHANATRVELALRQTTARHLEIWIKDNGSGLAEALDISTLAKEGHLGLLGISERVALLGGRFRLQPSSEGGTLLVAEIPHPRAEPQEEI